MAFTAVAPLVAAASQQKASSQEQLPENMKQQLQGYKGTETKVKVIQTCPQVEKEEKWSGIVNPSFVASPR